MSSKKMKLWQRANSTSYGWRNDELKELYERFGFEIELGSKHDVAKHPIFKSLRGTITRSSEELHPDYIRHAVEVINRLKQLEGEKKWTKSF